MNRLRCLCLCIAALLACAQPVAAASLLDLAGRPAERITFEIALDGGSLPDTVLATYTQDTARQRSILRRAVRGQRMAEALVADAATLGWLRATSPHGERLVRLFLTGDGTVVARGAVRDRDIYMRCADELLAPFRHEWLIATGAAAEAQRQENGTELEREARMAWTGDQLIASPWLLTDERIRERVFRGTGVRAMGTKRRLRDETIHVRLPPARETDEAPGLLVWVTPQDKWILPAQYRLACDELNLVLVGAEGIGNDRDVADRLQLSMDAVATVVGNMAIDTSRIYVSGVSGGGRCTSMLWAAFPEVFTGAMPIVGMNCYRNVPSSPGRYWRKGFGLPKKERLELLRTRPFAPITGPEDFNYPEMTAAAEFYRSDGFVFRLFDIPGMGHTMAEEQHVLEAVRWLDAQQPGARSESVTIPE